ncbi:AAA family ATPase [Methylocaldum sp. MU1018]
MQEERVGLYQRGITVGEPLDVDALLSEARKIEAAQKAALTRRSGEQSGSVIRAFNDANDIGAILERNGYIGKGRNRWLYPGSTSGLPGVRMLPDSIPKRVYSSHDGDPLNDGNAHDAFDCWRILEHGGDMTRAVKEAARLMGMDGRKASATTPARGEHQPGDDDAPAGEYARDVSLIRASDVTPEAIAWLWNGWLAAGKMHVFGGAPGTGKTTISMALAATVTTGGRWPDGTRSIAGNVVIWSGEDDPADTLIPRLALSGADLSRVYFIADIREGNERRSFDPARDMEPLRRKLAEIGGVKLLIVDPVVSAIAGDSHKNAEVRRGLQPLVDLAGAMRCALLGITHFSKGTGGRDPVERLTGSLAFGALARVVLVAAKHQEEGEDGRTVRLFCRAKSNIGPDDGGFEYDLHQAELKTHPGIFASSVLWGDAVEGAARELLATADATGDDGGGGTLADAKRFLADLLADGPLPGKTIKADADGAGYSWATIRRAQKALGIEAVKEGMKGGWVWRMPGQEAAKAILENAKMLKNAEDAQQKKVSTFGEIEHLRGNPGAVEVEI